jgi:hypothetical protein
MTEWGQALRVAAENFANEVDSRELDFTMRSLGRLDQVLVRATQKPEIFRKIFTGMSAYLGEVLVRCHGCHWGTEDGQDAKVIGDLRILPPADAVADAQPIKPMELLQQRFARNIALGDLVIELAGTWYVTAVAAPAADVATEMRRVADVLVGAAKAAGELGLDYSPASVLLLDDFIEEGWGPRPKRGTYESMIPAIGAYVGEVLVAQTQGRWIRTESGEMAIEIGRVVAFPMNKVGKRFERGRGQSIAQFYREIVSQWRSGSEGLPATWRVVQPEKPKRSLFGLRRG